MPWGVNIEGAGSQIDTTVYEKSIKIYYITVSFIFKIWWVRIDNL